MRPDVLAERRDQALRDLVELDRQLAAGEVTAADAEDLRARYEADAAAAALALRDLPPDGARQRRRRSRSERAAYLVAALTAAAAFVLLPQAVKDRPPGGFVTGNEIGPASRPPTQAPRQDLSAVPDAELEAAVRADPTVTGMRLALADRYTDQRRFDEALVHYGRVLEQDPGNARATARTGWILFQTGQPTEAARLVALARRADPLLLEAIWFDANVLLYGLQDPAAALQALADLRARPDLAPAVAQQVAELEAEARTALGAPE